MNIKRWFCIATAVVLSASVCCAEEAVQTYTEEQVQELETRFSGVKYTQTLKPVGYDAPVMTQRFGADPCALVYDGRVYLYMTGDVLEYDAAGTVKQNTYGQINTLNVVSSADLVNWTDHGVIHAAGKDGASKWGNNSWAPAVACKEINGQMKFFIYFANGGNGIGVLESDSPTGPFVDPLGKALVSRQTPNCASVTWLFDPAVLVDEDGSAYLYFGGGIPQGRAADPGTARVVKLGADMISLDGDPQPLDVPFLFEDSGINRIGDTYYYSYCTNWNVTPEAKKQYGFDSAQIVYMTSDSPMGPFTNSGVILKNPGAYYGCYGTNHHCLFQFHGDWYIAYHTQMLEEPLKISGGYRSTSVSKLTVREDGSIPTLQVVNRYSLKQVGTLNPYRETAASTMATMAGLKTVGKDSDAASGETLVSDIQSGDWLAVYGVDFGEGATEFRVSMRMEQGAQGAIQLRLDRTIGPVIGYVKLDEAQESGDAAFAVTLTEKPEGVHHLLMIFDGEGYALDSWQFAK